MDEKTGNTHRARVVGSGGDTSTDPFTEHRDTATPDDPPADELTARRRAAEGPTTHDDTRTTRKDGA